MPLRVVRAQCEGRFRGCRPILAVPNRTPPTAPAWALQILLDGGEQFRTATAPTTAGIAGPSHDSSNGHPVLAVPEKNEVFATAIRGLTARVSVSRRR